MKGLSDYTSFEEQYLALRRKEGRLYSDEELAFLPSIRATHPLKKEWNLRKESCRRLITYLRRKNKQLSVMEVGCGNGWFCHQLSKIPEFSVTGVDINKTELEQAKRVFPSLRFLYQNLTDTLLQERFDIIVFAASFQYFSSPAAIVPGCFDMLKEGGEIHILDTHFYADKEAMAAAERSRAYFAEMDCPELRPFYFHHTLQSLQGYNYQLLYNPRSLFNYLFFHSPFPWIRIKP